MQRNGMTLTSVLVAVALTSALAVATAKLISNQAKLNKIMTLTDQRDMIARFYTALMHNRLVWRCTLYDPNNSALLDFISKTANSFSGNVELRTPDCKFKENFKTGGTKGIEELRVLTNAHGSGDHYRSSGAFFATNNPVILGDSLTEHDNSGWWKVSLTASAIAKGSVDLTLTIEFDENNYKTRHANFDPPDIRDRLEYKVRKGDPNVQGGRGDCGNHAIVAIDDLASGSRGITCSIDPLVNVPGVGVGGGGNFLHTLPSGQRVGGDRTGLTWPVPEYHAIEHIGGSTSFYESPQIAGSAAVLGFARGTTECHNYVAGDLHGANLPALAEIDVPVRKWDHHLGPQGKQGIPGPPGYKGPQGPPGPDAACPSGPTPPCP